MNCRLIGGPGAFDKLTRLVALDLSYNHLNVITSSMIRLPALESLSLGHNFLTSNSAMSVEGTHVLGTLDIAGALTYTTSLRSLSLDSNIYLAFDHPLDPHLFTATGQLEAVNLCRIGATSLPTALRNSTVSSLDLSYNYITELPQVYQ